jgi:hypothetical protein
MSVAKFIKLYSRLSSQKQPALFVVCDRFLTQVFFVRDYYLLNELMWQDGFLIDFLQKKVVDKWVRKFLIYSAYLFNERLVFDKVVKFYIDMVFWPTQQRSIFEFSNVSSTLFITLFILITLFLLISLAYLAVFLLA